MIYTFYEIDTGKITRVKHLRPDRVADYTQDGEAVYEGEVETRQFDKIIDGQPAATEKTFDAVGFARFVRNQALMESDWTQSADSPFDSGQKNQLRRWRQDLRDFPSQVADCTSEQDVLELLPIKPRV